MQNIDCINVRGQKVSVAEIVAAIDLLGSRYVLIADEPGKANEVARLRPNVQVIYRDYYPRGIPGIEDGDDNLHLKISPQQWIDWMQGLGLAPGIWWYCGNEPAGEWGRLATWIEQVLPLANAVGRRLVVGNFSVGVPEPEDWNGPLLPILKALRDGKHTLGLHEYMVESCAASQPHYVARFLKAWDAASRAGYARPHTLITEADFDLRGSWVIQCQGSAERFAQEFQKAAKLYYLHGIDGVFHFSFGSWARGKPGEPGYTGDFDVRPALAELAKVQNEANTVILDRLDVLESLVTETVKQFVNQIEEHDKRAGERARQLAVTMETRFGELLAELRVIRDSVNPAPEVIRESSSSR